LSFHILKSSNPTHGMTTTSFRKERPSFKVRIGIDLYQILLLE
jgi:hypothetical protein